MQTWLKDSLNFLRGHIRRKGVSKSSMFKSPLRPADWIWYENQHDIRCYSSAIDHKPFMLTSCCRHYHCWRSSFRSVPADEVDDFQFFGAHQDPTPNPSHSESIYTLRLNTWRNQTFWPSGMRQWNFAVKHSTRPKNARDRWQQLNRSPHFNFQKQPRPDTYPVPIPVVQPTQIAATQPATVISKE